MVDGVGGDHTQSTGFSSHLAARLNTRGDCLDLCERSDEIAYKLGEGHTHGLSVAMHEHESAARKVCCDSNCHFALLSFDFLGQDLAIRDLCLALAVVRATTHSDPHTRTAAQLSVTVVMAPDSCDSLPDPPLCVPLLL